MFFSTSSFRRAAALSLLAALGAGCSANGVAPSGSSDSVGAAQGIARDAPALKVEIARAKPTAFRTVAGVGLSPVGDFPDWNREPWRSLPGYREQWEAVARRGARRALPHPPQQTSGCGSHPVDSLPAADKTEQGCSAGLAFPGPAGTGSSAVLRTEPESIRKREGFRNEPIIAGWVRVAISAARRLLDRRSDEPEEKDAVCARRKRRSLGPPPARG